MKKKTIEKEILLKNCYCINCYINKTTLDYNNSYQSERYGQGDMV